MKKLILALFLVGCSPMKTYKGPVAVHIDYRNGSWESLYLSEGDTVRIQTRPVK